MLTTLPLPVRAATLLAVALTCLGCRRTEEIRTYRVAKSEADTPPGATAPAAPTAPQTPTPRTGEPTDRMLGAIVPGPQQAWFFKAVGPRAAIDPHAEAITAFLASVRFDGDSPSWSVPEGWTERPGGGMRLATLVIPTAGEGTELSVIGLGLVGDWGTQVLDNVNRWRKQLGQPPTDAAGLDQGDDPLADVATGAVLFDETGWFESGSMAPFAGGGRNPLASSAATPSPPAVAPPRPPAPAELTYQTPDGWTDGKQSAMRKASLVTPEGAEVTAFAFQAAGAMGDPVDNANRWRGEVGLAPVTAEELAEQTESIELLEGEGSYFEFVGPEETTHAAMVVRDGLAWFFKIRGSGEAVASQRDAFRAWLASMSL